MADPLTIAWLKETFLTGVRLTDQYGQPFPDSIFTLSLEGAIQTMQAELDVVLTGVETFTERYDADHNSPGSYYQIQFDHRPVRTVENFWIQWATDTSFALGPDWVLVRDPVENGTVEIVPGIQALSSTILISGPPYNLNWGALGARGGRVPGWLKFQYTAGFDGTTYPYPADILLGIGKHAAILALDTAGDLILGAGIASQSVSIDGLSQSIGTTSSATNAGYGAKIKSYRDQLKAEMPMLIGKYRGVQFGAI